MRRAPFPLSSLGLVLLFAAPLLDSVSASSSFGPSHPQSTATLIGKVSDQNDAVVAGARVMVRNSATSRERITTTDDQGTYQFAALPVGYYRLEISANGFRKTLLENLGVEVARTVVQNFRLEVGDLAQTVKVTPEAKLIETTTVSVGQVIDHRTAQELPLNGRHFIDLGLLVPGSVTPPQNGNLSPPARGQGSFAMNTAGNREETVNYQVNGINLNDQINNIITLLPPLGSIQEFKVDNSTFSAEYGRNSGAIVNIATRQGANEIHGELFEYIRNDWLDARNFFNFTSKSIDYNSLTSPPTAVTVQDSHNLRNDRGLSDFDARHRFVVSGIYDLPFQGNRIKNGWRLATIAQLQSGNPLNIVTANTTVTGSWALVRYERICFSGPLWESRTKRDHWAWF